MRVSASKVGLLHHCNHWTSEGIPWSTTMSPAADRGNIFHAAVDLEIQARELVVMGAPGIDGEILEMLAQARKVWEPLVSAGTALSEEALGWDSSTDTTIRYGCIGRKYPEDGRLHGTPDLVVVYSDHLLVGDWKTGSAANSAAQLATLGLMAARAYNRELVTVVAWEVSPEGVTEVGKRELTDFHLAEIAMDTAELLAAKPGLPRPGSHCRDLYCPAVADCPTTAAALNQLLPAEHLLRHRWSLEIASPDHAAYMLETARMVETAAKNVREAIRAYVPEEGLILSDGRRIRESRRSVSRYDTAAAIALLRRLGASDDEIAGLYRKCNESAGLRIGK